MSSSSSLLVRGYEVVIGFETHAQLSTRSKIFSRAATAFGAEPNTQACAVDLALPGTLPVMNRAAVERAIRFGLSVGSHIAESSVFARKNYFYPDLPKGYQISQFEIPVVQGGEVSFFLGTEKKTVRLVRAHLEEDAGKSLHEDFVGQSGIDLNRAGTPLLEIVTEPDIRSSAEAVAYARELHKIVTWIGICDGNMQEGSFRCDANVSVRRKGAAELGTRREIKNLNSFRFLQQAIGHVAHAGHHHEPVVGLQGAEPNLHRDQAPIACTRIERGSLPHALESGRRRVCGPVRPVRAAQAFGQQQLHRLAQHGLLLGLGQRVGIVAELPNYIVQTWAQLYAGQLGFELMRANWAPCACP